jgi:hypothetical protein
MLRVMGSGDRGDPSDDIAHARTESPPVGHTVPSDSAAQGLGERPGSDQIARAVAKARIANQLFSKQQSVKLGRYHLLEMVGSGGMGVVWGAWDPELDRRVAIKLVKATMQAARDRILLEGQALAKLSHPNVVPVYDVGVVDEQVYLVMEWVRGKNLRAYCKEPRTIRELLAVYRAAGEGLSAAHRVGLIHRDFKPDNAMFGDDGRVRVLDFGLARGEAKPDPDSDDNASSDLTRGAGTPRYMPAEQAEGRELTPAVDQYAFCVSLREALAGRNADGKDDAVVPRWLDEILAKGTSREPANRYAGMDDLLRALARDPATVWRRRALIAGALGFAGATFAVGTTRAEAPESCVGGKDLIAQSWNDPIRDKLVTHLRTLGPYGQAEATRLVGVFDRYATDWADAHRSTCQAQERHEITPQLYEINLACLARTRVALETTIELASKTDNENLGNVVTAVGGLPSSKGCLDETHRSKLVLPPPPAVETQARILGMQVERARVLTRAVDGTAIAFTQDVVARTRAIGYKPLVAEALLELGHAHLHRMQKREAADAFATSSKEAFETGDLTTAIHAYAHRIYEYGADPGVIELLKWHAATLKGESAYVRAVLHNAEGGMALGRGDDKLARSAFKSALDAWDRSPEHTELAFLFANLAIITEDRGERDALMQQAVEGLVRTLGPDHPSVFDTQLTAAMLVEHPSTALRALQRTCFRWKDLHPAMFESVALCMYELSRVADELGELDDARAATRYIIAGKQLPDNVRPAAGYGLFLDGKYEAARAALQTAADALLATDDALLYTRASDAFAIAAVASERLQPRDPKRVVELYERALAALERSQAFTGMVFYKRRLARVQTALARLLARDQPARAKDLARRASDWYRAAGGYDKTVEELATITGSR